LEEIEKETKWQKWHQGIRASDLWYGYWFQHRLSIMHWGEYVLSVDSIKYFLYQCFLMDTVFNTGACPAPRCHCQVPTEAHALLQATYCWVQFKRLHLFYYYFDLFKPIYNFISPSQPNILFLENQPNILSYPFG
jgi:hypothetical protein